MAVCPTISGAASKSRNFSGPSVQIIPQTFRRTITEENHSCDRPVVAALVSSAKETKQASDTNAATSLDRCSMSDLGCLMFGVRCFLVLHKTANAQHPTLSVQ